MQVGMMTVGLQVCHTMAYGYKTLHANCAEPILLMVMYDELLRECFCQRVFLIQCCDPSVQVRVA